MSRLQNSRLLRQDCINNYGKVFLCSKYKASFLALVAYTQKKYEVLKLARIPKAINCVSLTLLILIVTSHYASAEGKAPLFKDDPTVPWHIVADEIHYDDTANQYIAKGNVTITKQDKNLSADYVRFDQKNMKAFANGHVIMTVGQDILTGSRMEMDLNTETGTVYNGTIFLQENHFYIKGDKLKKVGKNSYTADKASITTCDGDRPPWKITGRNLKITIEGYGFVKHAALWAKKIPVLYTPFLFFPAKLKRQSGLLPPQFGYSDRKGTEYIQPVYWAINRSSDATFYLDYMAHRGEKLGLEYRYVLDERSKGTLMYDFLNDEKVDDGSFDSSEKWGYEDDNFLRPNSSRYWFRMKQDQALPFDFSARLDLDIVSDQDYLLEFKDGLTGFKQTDSYFLETFGRDLDDNDDPVRTNSLNLNRIWPAYSLNAELLWYDNVTSRRWEETNTTLQKLPFIEFDGAKQRIFSSSFYFDLDSEYTYFYREDGARGHRMDAHPRFYLPFNYKNYFTVEPSLGVRETVWYLDKEKYSPSDKKRLNRQLYDTKIDLFSEIYNIFDLNGKSIDKIQHKIRPQITWDYIPDQDQDEYPWFDDLDRIEEQNRITYSITNTLISRSKEKKEKKEVHILDKPNGDESYHPPSHIYNQFCRFKLEQSYDINKEKEDDPEPLSPIYAELEIIPGKYFSIDADAEWSHYDNEFRSRNVELNLWDNRGDKLFLEYRYTIDSSESIYTDLLLKLSDRLSASAEYERDIFNGQVIKYGLGFLYERQCWSLEFHLIKDENDYKYQFMIKLFGIGEIG
ncbi:MAG: LPS-assembly protein LptD [Deltaproteobacteria bacterium]|nr:LPS-assembly protein LptD [Deltaproteobacteria bacterium]MBW1958875.1 LPS-assembly protein LptD [Deltaproteobacteria bacterium]MBW2012889.1 LPS-assembly protein LptD [Deltaproteobacteria bacterium]MBW2088329.1 LPS-assembly protein LptD [Deltaproteobacteria bacterium]MBW2320154.1 LPS-assembly protein LptD [Deltaproteobacteria bacterium]